MNDGERSRRKIDRWEMVDVLYSHQTKTKGATVVGVRLEIRKPVFEDGEDGVPRMSFSVERSDNRSERYVRLLCYNGNLDEVVALKDAMSALSIEECKEKYDRITTSLQGARSNRSDVDYQKSGGGPSRFMLEPKVERKRRRRGGDNRV